MGSGDRHAQNCAALGPSAGSEGGWAEAMGEAVCARMSRGGTGTPPSCVSPSSLIRHLLSAI